MAEVLDLSDGGYRFVKGVYPYSAGVAPLVGYELERARFHRPMPLAAGFKAIEAHLKSIGRPLTALCACELRSPAPFTEQGFADFNQEYVGKLIEWNLFRNDVNPVARSNVCPEIDKPATPSFYAFTYTVPARRAGSGVARPSFVVAGSGECPEGLSNYHDHIIRRNDVSPVGLLAKAQWVLGEMERRMAALGFGWRDATATQVYTVHDIHGLMASELGPRGLLRDGLTWHFNRPPVDGLEFEMDCRAVTLERVLQV